ncbi:MAG TPA: hypothetical protein VHC69_11920 [Polyangiaceae bacterium]|nr:hypothetical protein [Polyangiaceae bacterium]
MPGADGSTLLLGACTAASTLEPIPAREALLQSGAADQPSLLFVRDLFDQFRQNCGGCHVDQTSGGFHVGATTFRADMLAEDNRAASDGTLPHGALARINSDDPNLIMPPGSKPVAQRDPNSDPTLLLATKLKAWYDAGSPPDFYPPPASTTSGGDFKLSQSVGLGLTNLGNCIPNKELIGILPAKTLDAMDAKFAAMTALPGRIEDTDITTFDSQVLAQSGVVAYAPAYPLWSDNARKIRYVRVPHGKSIVFDKDTQQFQIPDNTRFYKTFFKKVIELDGAERWRKVETRIIVTRTPTKDANGNDVQTALFGTYAWSDDESEALLVQDPLRDQQPFADRLITLHADERLFQQISSGMAEAGGASSLDLTRELERAGATRRYAIPGSERCIQCHMGSPSRSFSLGFTPLQVNRRPLGVGGIIEPPGRDDLTQLRRLIDYGVITGIDNVSDIRLLEKSEGPADNPRLPRNDYELVAQGYMVGNCAHCHNPLGYPSVQNPDTLKPALSFLPGAGGIDGIFQYPLNDTPGDPRNAFSPRIFRDLGGSVRMPYITPSLVDYPAQADLNHQVKHDLSGDPTQPPQQASRMVLAPWRSLIYRNVDTPFAYSNDLALFPHMPMNVPGFDCRLPQIMAEWMVSIPAVRKNPGIDETLVQNPDEDQITHLHNNTGTDTEEQPYVEVKVPVTMTDAGPHAPNYDAAVQAAQQRLDAYHSGGAAGLSADKNDFGRYGYCPDTTDIVDWDVTSADAAHLAPVDLKTEFKADATANKLEETYNIPVDFQPVITGPTSGLQFDELGRVVPHDAVLLWPDEGVPDRPHWVPTDTTDNPGPWQPRRSDWADVLVSHKPDSATQNKSADDITHEQWVVDFLSPASPSTSNPGVTMTPAILAYATNDIPYGIWKQKTGCTYPNQKRVSDFQGASRPKWMDYANAAVTPKIVPPNPNAYVYSEWPGAAVFNMVCVNCHGPLADSHGRQADTLQLMTGGDARVANFRDGLFGPVSNPGANREAVFAVSGSSVSADDWSARYLAWMALGGTSKKIPKAILDVVTSTPILGRPRLLPGVDGANMLGPVQTLCESLFPPAAFVPQNGMLENTWQVAVDFSVIAQPPSIGTWAWDQSLFFQFQRGVMFPDNGDAELWANLCSIDNPKPVTAIYLSSGAAAGTWTTSYFNVSDLSPGAPLGNDRGTVDDAGYVPGNLMPWCVVPTSSVQQTIQAFKTVDGKPLPQCPASWANPDAPKLKIPDLRKWSYRGAINGGLAVFLYVDRRLERGIAPVPSYDHCEALTP